MPATPKAAAGEPAAPDPDLELVDRYEQLRADALDGTAQGWRWGRAVLQRRGVAAWIATWTELDAGVPARPIPAAPLAPITPPGSEQLVAVLAAMALACTTTITGG